MEPGTERSSQLQYGQTEDLRYRVKITYLKISVYFMTSMFAACIDVTVIVLFFFFCRYRIAESADALLVFSKHDEMLKLITE